jgi:sulfofructose kinase
VIADLDEAYAGIDELLSNVDFLIASRDFPRHLCGESHLEKALPLLQNGFHSRLAAATLGVDGVLACDAKQFHYASAYSVPVVDTTGAGDIFHAGFIYGLLHDWPLQRTLEFACAAAALNCSARGARGAIRSIGEIESLMATGQKYAAAWDGTRLKSRSE